MQSQNESKNKTVGMVWQPYKSEIDIGKSDARHNKRDRNGSTVSVCVRFILLFLHSIHLCVFVSFLYNIFIGNAFVILMVRASMT